MASTRAKAMLKDPLGPFKDAFDLFFVCQDLDVLQNLQFKKILPPGWSAMAWPKLRRPKDQSSWRAVGKRHRCPF